MSARFLACLAVSTLLIVSSQWGWAEVKPIDGYLASEHQGWTVYVNVTCAEQRPVETKEALQLLDEKLTDIVRVVPYHPLLSLQKVPIFVQSQIFDLHGLRYNPSSKWLKEHNDDPRKAGGVEINNVADFLSWSQHQPWVVLHELSHAYHHQVLGYSNKDVKNAFSAANQSGLYQQVAVVRKREKVRSYALNNEQEYFAELSEAYFGRNDFFPFSNQELLKYDPVGYQMVAKVWGAR